MIERDYDGHKKAATSGEAAAFINSNHRANYLLGVSPIAPGALSSLRM
jgi:hypothetical protein